MPTILHNSCHAADFLSVHQYRAIIEQLHGVPGAIVTGGVVISGVVTVAGGV